MSQLDRFHDFERTMQLNYFGAVRLVIEHLATHDASSSDGQIINISSIGVLGKCQPASLLMWRLKRHWMHFSRCLSAEVHSHKIAITSVYMPLVRTPMIAPTKIL